MAHLDTMENVSFFEEPPPAQEFATPQPRREPWRGTPDDTLGVPVAFAEILAHNDEVAVLISGLMVFPAGFGISVVLLSRLNPSRLPFHTVGRPPGPIGRSPGGADPAEQFRFGVGLADGTKVLADRRWQPDQVDLYTLKPQGGGGGGRNWRQNFLFEPLPPAGPLEFVCEWPSYGLAESRLQLDATVILEAAKQAKPLWPDDVGLPEPDPRPSSRISSVATSATSAVIRASQPQRHPPVASDEVRAVTPKMLHYQDLTVASDYGQFWIYGTEAAIEKDIMSVLNAALKGAGIAAADDLVVVLSPHQNNFELPLRVEIWSDEPESDADDWDEVAEASLRTNTNEVQWSSPTLESTRLDIPGGLYRLRISGRGFVSRGWPGSTTPGDSWRLQFWPSECVRARRIKSWNSPLN